MSSKRARARRRQAKRLEKPQREQRLDAANAVQRLDNWVNTAGGQGIRGRDKRTAHGIGCAIVFRDRRELDDLYHGNDLAHRICRKPAEDMTREWLDLKIEGDEQGDGKATAQAEQAEELELQLQELGAKAKICDAITWARLTGGGKVFLGVDDGLGDGPDALMRPLDFDRIQTVRFLTVLDRFELSIAAYDDDPLSPTYGQPLLYRFNTTGTAGVGRVAHASRFLHFDGSSTTRHRRRHDNNGWADSIFVKMFQTVRGFGTVWDSAEILMQDFAQAVIKIKDLADLFATKGAAAVEARIEALDYSRSVLHAMLLDAEYEDFERKPTPMTGLPEILDRFLHRVAAAAEMPITVLFGMSPGGLNATGESDIRNWYDTISAKQETELREPLEYLLRVLLSAQDGPTKGKEPEAWSFAFRPLWQMSDQEKADLRNKQAQTDQIYINALVLSPEEIAVSRFGGEGYSLETVLNEEAREELAEEKEARDAAEEAALEQGKPGVERPGAEEVPK